jgi:hypothetical protein
MHININVWILQILENIRKITIWTGLLHFWHKSTMDVMLDLVIENLYDITF